jgi:hypothetical protein
LEPRWSVCHALPSLIFTYIHTYIHTWYRVNKITVADLTLLPRPRVAFMHVALGSPYHFSGLNSATGRNLQALRLAVPSGPMEYKKGKVVAVLNEGAWRTGCIDPHFLNLETSLRSASRPGRFTLGEKAPVPIG